MSRLIFVLLALALPTSAKAEDRVITNVYRAPDLGDGYVPPKDYFVNAGLRHGVRAGSVLKVYRRIATADNVTAQHNGEMVVPIATLRVIHAEGSQCIARLDKMAPDSVTVSDAYLGLRVGDIVR
jgi:hypothetical protein